MMKKGVSTVIATILMLIITIALASVAWLYMSGFLSSRLAVNLAINGETDCIGGQTDDSVVVWVRNDGTANSGTLQWTDVPGNPNPITDCTFTPDSLDSGETSTVTCTRTTAERGYWKVRIFTASSNTITAEIFCAS